MAYSELVKSFERIRSYMREFYVYGFKSREEYSIKSARSYDNERRRIESWIGDFMSFHQDTSGKNVFLSVDSRRIPHNPLHKAFKKYEAGKKTGIIHFDAHPDLCDCYEGNIWSHANTEKRALDDIVSPEDMLLLGIRAAEPEEVDIMTSGNGISVISATDVFRRGYMDCWNEIYDKFRDYDSIYFTLDIDVLDPAFAPGTGTPCSGGITSRELIELVRYIVSELPVKHMDIVEVAPPLDINDITSWAAVRIIEEVFSVIDRRRDYDI